MATTIEREMMSACCGAEGKFDFESMKAFMERCGNKEFTRDELEEMEQRCRDQGEFCDKMMRMMKGCACECDSPSMQT